MYFLNPSFLWALFLTGIPILIHFLNLQKPKKQVFTNISFLKEIQLDNRRLNTLRSWLILLFRCLAIIFLVLAFSQPMPLKSSFSNIGSSESIFVLDNSYSLSVKNSNGNGSLLESSKEIISSILKTQKSVSTTLFTHGLEGVNPLDADEIAQQQTIASIQFANQTSPFTQFVQQILSDQKESSVYVVTDAQASFLKGINKLPNDTLHTWYFLPIESKSVSNIYVDTLWMEHTPSGNQSTLSVHVRVKNGGLKDAEQVSVRLTIGGIQVSASTLPIIAGASSDLTFVSKSTITSAQEGVVSIDGDEVVFDNEFNFVVQPIKTIKILHVAPFDIQDESNYVSSVYQNEPMFSLKKTLPASFMNLSEWDASLIILHGWLPVDPAIIKRIQTFRSKGGALMIIPSTVQNTSSILTYLNSESVLASAADTNVYAAKDAWLEPISSESPIFASVFEGRWERNQLPYSKPTLMSNSGVLPILKNRYNHTVFSVASSKSSRSLFILHHPLHKRYTNMHLHALFVPLMYRIALIQGGASYTPYHRLNAEYITLTNEFDQDMPVVFQSKEKESYIPVRKRSETGEHLFIHELPLKSGFYSVDQGKNNVGIVAFNVDKSESDMSLMSTSEIETALKKSFRHVKVLQPSDVETAEKNLEASKQGVPLWKYCVILALSMMLAEILTVRYLNKKVVA